MQKEIALYSILALSVLEKILFYSVLSIYIVVILVK